MFLKLLLLLFFYFARGSSIPSGYENYVRRRGFWNDRSLNKFLLFKGASEGNGVKSLDAD